MKKFSKFFLGLASVALMASCSDDKLVGGSQEPLNPSESEDGVFFSVNISLPSPVGGRSITDEPDDNGNNSNSGHEVGQDYENVITEAIVVLADAKNNGFIAAAPIAAGDLIVKDQNKTQYTAMSKFTKTSLNAFYSTLTPGSKDPISANIFLFCNPPQGLKDVIFGDGADTQAPIVGENKWLNSIGSVDTNSPIWTSNYFLMSNALIEKREIPGTIDDWNKYTSAGNPFHLSANNTGDSSSNNINNASGAGGNGGAIKVERVAARFDFRDGATDTDKPFTYHVVYLGSNDQTVTDKTPLIDITLQKMAMVNVGKKYYYLPHMIDGNADGTIGTIDEESLLKGVCTPEEPWFSTSDGSIVPGLTGNYVLDVDYKWKQSVTDATTSGFAENLLYPFFNEQGLVDNNSVNSDRWATSLCADVVKGTLNNTENWENSNKDYHIWRYATENTVPSVSGQINGVTTGVVFKGRMVATKEALESEDQDIKAMASTINNVDNKLHNSYKDPILYQFNNSLYMSWDNVRKAAIAAAQPTFKFVPAEDFETTGSGEWVIETFNRSNSFYVAVFGKGGCGDLTFTYTEGEGETAKPETVTIKDPIAPDADCSNAKWTSWNENDKPDTGDLIDGFRSAATEAGFTIYQSSYDPNFGWGYYCYYYYWNRHNYNGNPGVMGPMEFAVVRNNVYKLAVTKIKQLGHPRISVNDPNRPKPGTPDESEDVYIDVDAQVLPWVVRVNDIEF